MAEQWVKLLAHWKGCEVFQNVGCTGSTDIVLIHPELGTLQIDVKCATWQKNGKGYWHWIKSSAATVEAPVYAVVVIPDGDIGDWKVQWRNKAKGGSALKNPQWVCPPGWEDFWSNDNRIYTTTSTQPTNA